MIRRIIIVCIIFTFTLYSVSFCADPKLIQNITKGLEKIKDWIIKISTPAAAVAIGTGILMKKFSFGDEEKIIMGKKLIKSTLFSYAFILSIDLVLKVISLLAEG